MAEPDWNPDTGGRPLAEILREAGIDTSRAAKRRRWDDPDEQPIRQRRPDAEPAGRPAFGRRRTDLEDAEPAARSSRGSSARPEAARPEAARSGASRFSAAPPKVRPSAPPSPRDRRPVADPSTAAIPGLRPERAPAVPHPSAPLPDVTVGALRDERDPLRDTGRATGRPVRAGQRAAPRDEHFSTGPIPVVRATDVDDLDDDATPQESALAWLRFAGELVIALAVGVGVFFAATVLWEMASYVALLLVPLAVTGLVAGVGMWRQRQGEEPVGPRLLAVLVFAGTLLTIVPAAQLLATR
ncbi:hypothetical protein [Candidatus Blastococcus massiliensis]|uniref:hypothetical protein n=1 Tax=Candidatus Blastococcus massiliensis TaxID=1470358 RepID=UPI00058AD56D|nr:hypothetical protein [Candidatus Blastococcus massiliensis]